MYSLAPHQHLNSSSPSSSGLGPSAPSKAHFFSGTIFIPGSSSVERYYARKKRRVLVSLENGRRCVGFRFRDTRMQFSSYHRFRRVDGKLPLATADDGLTINSSAQTGRKNDFDDLRYKLNEPTQDEDYSSGLVQLLHDTARIFELAIKEKTSLSKIYWFSTAWLGMDNSAWAKTLSYQVSVYSLLQAVSEVSSRGDERDRDINVFVQRSMLRHCTPLEDIIKDKLLAKGPELYEWCVSEQVQAAVSSFINYIDGNYFSPTTTMYRKDLFPVSGKSNDVSLLMLALSCIAAITKLGPTTISCSQFFSTIPDMTGRQMNMLVDYVSVPQSYSLMKEIGLRREFLLHFGPRAAACRLKNVLGTEEIVFWVGLIQKQLQQAIHREKMWSRLTTSESIEVLGRDLAIFGFFIALGRSTQSFLLANGFRKVSHWGKCAILSSAVSDKFLSTVCGGISNKSKDTHGDKTQVDTPNFKSIDLVLDVCLHWMESFIKHSTWLENPSNVKASRFLAKGYAKLKSCRADLGIDKDIVAVNTDTQSFDKALESVEDAVLRLEELLKELHVSNSGSGKEHLKAACSNLEGIRRLKKEAEFLEASFRAKEASISREDIDQLTSPVDRQQESSSGIAGKSSKLSRDKNSSGSIGLWRFIVGRLTNSSDVNTQDTKDNDDLVLQEEPAIEEMPGNDSNEVQRFEVLKSELMELERRVQRSSSSREYEEEEFEIRDSKLVLNNTPEGNSLAPVEKKDDGIIGKSLDKLKETSTDVLQGTQLLAIDTAAAIGLLRRALIGDELTEKEKQALQRTLTDLASVIPIGILMLLPVTAVGHAAMLAAIQRYMPALIPSTYGQDRLDLLRKLQKVKELEDEVNTSIESGQE